MPLWPPWASPTGEAALLTRSPRVSPPPTPVPSSRRQLRGGRHGPLRGPPHGVAARALAGQKAHLQHRPSHSTAPHSADPGRGHPRCSGHWPGRPPWASQPGEPRGRPHQRGSKQTCHHRRPLPAHRPGPALRPHRRPEPGAVPVPGVTRGPRPALLRQPPQDGSRLEAGVAGGRGASFQGHLTGITAVPARPQARAGDTRPPCPSPRPHSRGKFGEKSGGGGHPARRAAPPHTGRVRGRRPHEIFRRALVLN